ncbi:hypothetical protein HU200_025486 [Digitaria exilis]|uniref:GH10 domain-containing protein n=1 Tax=Digitaria exilis TaxID=1010633 RepID=A0A835ESG7_9POAL|nr:hypothetical protein HU200_025486 [Digitaria exilis]
MKVSTGKLIFFLLIVLFEGGYSSEQTSEKADDSSKKPSVKVPYDYSANIEASSAFLATSSSFFRRGVVSLVACSSRLIALLCNACACSASRSQRNLCMAAASSAATRARAPRRSRAALSRSTSRRITTTHSLFSKGTGDITAVIVTPDGKFTNAGAIVAQSECWTLLKGGATSLCEGKGDLFFQDRKKKVKITVESGGKPLPDAELSVEWVAKGFPLGNAMTKEILDIPEYEEWFTRRFKWATMENEMKWYSTEYHEGDEGYEAADRMLALAQRHNISVRGHSVFWDDQSHQMGWVSKLGEVELRAAVAKHLESVVSRYAGKVIHWDVVNENLHFSFFEDKLGKDASAEIFKEVAKLDSKPILFMNEFNTIEQAGDLAPVPTNYSDAPACLKDGFYYLVLLAPSHFDKPNIPYMRGSLDTLAAAKVPIWLTEVDVAKGPKQVEYLEEVMREGFGHPGVKGIMMWAAWHAKGCYVMCLTDNNFKNLPVGDVVDRLLEEWRKVPEKPRTDGKGVFEAELFHGEYRVTVKHESLKEPIVQTVDLDSKSEAKLTC